MEEAKLQEICRLSGNDVCADCETLYPEWASISLSVLVCLECSGRHRGLGVNVSFVRSLKMDTWSSSQIQAMQVGGNDKLNRSFEAAGVPKAIIKKSIRQKYNNNVADSYRSKIKALSLTIGDETSEATGVDTDTAKTDTKEILDGKDITGTIEKVDGKDTADIEEKVGGKDTAYTKENAHVKDTAEPAQEEVEVEAHHPNSTAEDSDIFTDLPGYITPEESSEDELDDPPKLVALGSPMNNGRGNNDSSGVWSFELPSSASLDSKSFWGFANMVADGVADGASAAWAKGKEITTQAMKQALDAAAEHSQRERDMEIKDRDQAAGSEEGKQEDPEIQQRRIRELQAFYQQHAPEKVGQAETFLEKHAFRDIVFSLNKKYGAVPGVVSAASGDDETAHCSSDWRGELELQSKFPSTDTVRSN